MPQIRSIIIWFTGILALIVIVSCIVYTASVIYAIPNKPSLSNSTIAAEQAAKANEIANYKELSTVLQSQRSTIFDVTVKQIIYPMFQLLITAVLAYIFAKTVNTMFEFYVNSKTKKP